VEGEPLLDLDEIERHAKALALTPSGGTWVPGPWNYNALTRHVEHDEEILVAEVYSAEVGRFMAAAGPDRVLALVAALREARAEVERLKAEN
jgi:hypothetical protein